MPLKLIKTSWNGGLLSPTMDAREDINKYYSGASMMVNALVLPRGGFEKRPGTEFIGEAPNKCRLLPFEFSVDDTLIIETSNLLMRFYKSKDRVYETAKNIASITAATEQIEVTTHGYSVGDWVKIESSGNTVVDDKVLVVKAVPDVNNITLEDTQGVAIDITSDTGAVGTIKRVYEITSPYTSAQAFIVHTTQSADVMYLAHPDIHPQKLSRAGDADWTIVDVPFTGGPFLAENTDSADTVGFARTGGTARDGYYFPSGATGTLTAAGHTPFNANHVGALWLVKHTRPDNILKTADNDANTAPTGAGIRIKGDFTFVCGTFAAAETVILWRKQGNGEWQEFREFLAASIFPSTEEDDDVFYAFTRDKSGGGETTVNKLTAKRQVNYGVVEITGFTNTGLVDCEVKTAVLSDNSTDNAVTTSLWAEGAWSDYRGYPRTVTFFEDRLWWASSTNNPDTLWSSKSGLYENMSFTDQGFDDEAITFPINDNEVSQLQWMMPRQVMAVGAANREYRFGASDRTKSATPSDRKATPQTSEGSHTIQPKILKDSIFFFLRQGRKLGKMKFDAIAENFDVDEATMLANAIFESAPTTMAVQRVPDSIVWATREDGVLVSLTYEPKEEVMAWAEHLSQNTFAVGTPNGFFESVAVIHGSTEDELWDSARRTVNGNTVYHTEVFSTRFFDQVDEAIMFDSAKTNLTGNVSGDLILASDTVRYGSGLYGSSLYGGTV